MTRLEFFKRVAGLCGLSLVGTTVAHAVKPKPQSAGGGLYVRPEDLDCATRILNTPVEGYTFRWTGYQDNDWSNHRNWWIIKDGTSYDVPSWGLYPGQDPNRLDNVIIPSGTTCHMPANISILNSLTVKSGATLYQDMNGIAPTWSQKNLLVYHGAIVEDGAWVGRAR